VDRREISPLRRPTPSRERRREEASAHSGRNDRPGWRMGGSIQCHASPILLVSYRNCNCTKGQKMRAGEQPFGGKTMSTELEHYSDEKTTLG
jgi:hypothetical protein